MRFCTQCGAEGSGRFCSSCGATLAALPCPACGEEIAAGTRFCTACGAPARGGSSGASGTAPAGNGAASSSASGNAAVAWWVSGGLLLVLLVIVLWSELGDGQGSTAAVPGAAPALGPAPNVDLSSMTPREAADNLFNRVMTAVANENTTEANNFLPMAIAAYEMAEPLDADGLFHLSLLERAAGELEGARATALRGLEANPDHLLNLSQAAAVEAQMGDTASARDRYARMLAVWDTEIAAGRREYTEHQPLLPILREDAEALLGEGADGGTEP